VEERTEDLRLVGDDPKQCLLSEPEHEDEEVFGPETSQR
jgi:hypothetical protein